MLTTGFGIVDAGDLNNKGYCDIVEVEASGILQECGKSSGH